MGLSVKKLVMALMFATAGGGTVAAAEPGYLTAGVGSWETMRDPNRATEFDLAYRFADKFWIFKPQMGLLSATDGDYYGYAGVVAELPFGRHFVLTFSSAVGGYGGHGFDLGSTFEFRNGGEIAWEFENRSRLGVGFYHISNAGITSRNPGEESALIVYSLPIYWVKHY